MLAVDLPGLIAELRAEGRTVLAGKVREAMLALRPNAENIADAIEILRRLKRGYPAEDFDAGDFLGLPEVAGLTLSPDHMDRLTMACRVMAARGFRVDHNEVDAADAGHGSYAYRAAWNSRKRQGSWLLPTPT